MDTSKHEVISMSSMNQQVSITRPVSTSAPSRLATVHKVAGDHGCLLQYLPMSTYIVHYFAGKRASFCALIMDQMSHRHLALLIHQATNLRHGHCPFLVSLVPVISLLAIERNPGVPQNIPLQPLSNPAPVFAQAVVLIQTIPRPVWTVPRPLSKMPASVSA